MSRPDKSLPLWQRMEEVSQMDPIGIALGVRIALQHPEWAQALFCSFTPSIQTQLAKLADDYPETFPVRSP